ncbi:Guanine nucleotide-binding protein-like 3 [Chamberlinius hualienensis]
MVKNLRKKKSKSSFSSAGCKTNKKGKKQFKKHRREERKNKKNLGIPSNVLQSEEQILQEAQEYQEQARVLEQQHTQRKLEFKLHQKAERQKLIMEKRGLESFKSEIDRRLRQYENMVDSKHQLESSANLDPRSFKPFYREFRKVVESADVILEVLDARDPIGSRCPQVERAVIDAGPNKRLVLVLNKIDLIPSENLNEWLKYLRNEFPTMPFKASTQSQKHNLSWKRTSKSNMKFVSNDEAKVSVCMGADLLMKLLSNYCLNKGLKTLIRVGVVGFPNVGKSSIINSLKRNRACSVGSVPGITRSMQEVQLDKHIILLDSPGVVFAQKGVDAAGAALRNTVKIDNLEDAIPAVEAILRRTTVQQMMEHYNIAKFSSTMEFLNNLAHKRGRLKAGGVGNVEEVAKCVVNDWAKGKITFYTKPPEKYDSQIHISAEFVKEMAAEFDINSLELMETNTLSKFHSSNNVTLNDAIEVASAPPTEGTTEGFLPASVDDAVSVVSDLYGDLDNVKVKVRRKKEKSTKGRNDTVDTKGRNITVDVDEELGGNQRLNYLSKKAIKKFKRDRKKREKVAERLSEQLSACVKISDENCDVDVENGTGGFGKNRWGNLQ